MFGLKMRDLRICMSGVFAAASLLSIIMAFWVIQRTFHAQLEHAFSHPRVFLYDAILPFMAFIYAAAFWTIWKEKPSARGWGIAASILQMMFPIWQIIFRHKFIWNCHGEVLAIGTFGLIVFLCPYNKDSYMDDYETSEINTNDIEQEDNPS